MIDPNSELTTVEVLASAARTANVNGSAIDIKDFIGKCQVTLHSGDITAGDDNSTYTVALLSSTDNNISNASALNINVAASNVGAVQTVSVDTRVANQYLFAQGNISGANSPSFPLGVTLTGTKQIIG